MSKFIKHSSGLIINKKNIWQMKCDESLLECRIYYNVPSNMPVYDGSSFSNGDVSYHTKKLKFANVDEIK